MLYLILEGYKSFSFAHRPTVRCWGGGSQLETGASLWDPELCSHKGDAKQAFLQGSPAACQGAA